MQFYSDYNDVQKKYFRWGASAALVGLILALFSLSVSYLADTKEKLRSESGTQQISVTGEGKVPAKPDIATLNATIMTERPTVSDAQAKNTDSSNAVADFLEKSGVLAKDIKTLSYSIYPQYVYIQNKKPELSGYQVLNTIEIKIRDLTKVDDILGGIVQNGANEIGNVSFTIEDPNALKEQARKMAIEMAKEKAAVLSKDLGVDLTHITGFSENEGGVPPPIFYAKSTAYGEGGAVADQGPQLSGGEQEVKVSVTLTYGLRSW